tara:strand:- start:478 stop:1419 length:942 start_codon:yes stop_codon:yes gene_type:complete
MDVYQSDSGGYENGNMRKSEGENKLRAMAEYNSNLVKTNLDEQKKLKGKILTDQSEAMTSIGAKIAQISVSTAGDIGNLPARLEKYQEYVKAKAAGASDEVVKAIKKGSVDPVKASTENMSFAEKQAAHNPLAKPPPRPTNAPPEPAPTEPRAEGTPASSSGSMSDSHAVTAGAKDLGEGESLLAKGGKLAGKAVRGLSTAGDIAQGGLDLYADIKSGGIAGNNGFEKAGNVFQIGAGLADTVGLAFPPAELLGGLFGAVGGLFSGVGEGEEALNSNKNVAAADTKAADIKPVQETGSTAAVSSSVVATARDE